MNGRDGRVISWTKEFRLLFLIEIILFYLLLKSYPTKDFFY